MKGTRPHLNDTYQDGVVYDLLYGHFELEKLTDRSFGGVSKLLCTPRDEIKCCKSED